MKTNEFYFQFYVTSEQINYTNELVDYSIKHHKITDIFKNDPGGTKRQREYRMTGTLGEVVFSDAYDLERPKMSFGAIDGQDYGKDFVITINGIEQSFDVKTMRRKNNNFRENYVLNLPRYQMIRENVVTDYYYCISLNKDTNNNIIASFIGYVSKKDIENKKIGVLYRYGTKRIKDNGGFFIFQRDTYEIDFKDIKTPILNDKIKKFRGFQIKHILPPKKKNNGKKHE